LILSSDDPVSFDVKTWTQLSDHPNYSNAKKDYGLKKMTGVSIRLVDEPIAVVNFRQNHQNFSAIKSPFLKAFAHCWQ
jgi:hypothetical protein